MNWRPWVTQTFATTPKESRIGSMPVCRLRLSTTTRCDLLNSETNYLAPADLPRSASSTNVNFMITL